MAARIRQWGENNDCLLNGHMDIQILKNTVYINKKISKWKIKWIMKRWLFPKGFTITEAAAEVSRIELQVLYELVALIYKACNID